jgi:hypothetical protein
VRVAAASYATCGGGGNVSNDGLTCFLPTAAQVAVNGWTSGDAVVEATVTAVTASGFNRDPDAATDAASVAVNLGGIEGGGGGMFDGAHTLSRAAEAVGHGAFTFVVSPLFYCATHYHLSAARAAATERAAAAAVATGRLTPFSVPFAYESAETTTPLSMSTPPSQSPGGGSKSATAVATAAASSVLWMPRACIYTRNGELSLAAALVIELVFAAQASSSLSSSFSSSSSLSSALSLSSLASARALVPPLCRLAMQPLVASRAQKTAKSAATSLCGNDTALRRFYGDDARYGGR